MKNKNRRLKLFATIIVLSASGFIALSVQDDTDTISAPAREKITEPPKITRSNAVTPVPQKKSCQHNNSCTTTPKHAQTKRLPRTTTMKKPTTFKKIVALKKDIHKCRIDTDADSVQQVNQMITQLHNEVTLTKESYIVNKYLTLNITSPLLPVGFTEALINKIKILLEKYQYTFGLYLKEEVDINLVILPSKESYLDFIASLSIDTPYSQGVFWSRSNYAFIAFKNEQQAAETAFHETVHAINFSLIGVQSRWMNEGLAEFFETMELKETENGYTSSFNIQRTTSEQYPLDYVDLIYSEQQWDTEQRSQLYISSRSFLTYLVTHEQGIHLVRHLLQEERRDPCSALTDDTYIQLIEDDIFDLQSGYEEWLSENM